WSAALNPPLTTIAQPTYELGTTVAELLLQRIADPERAPVSIRLQPRLVIR
ncbi:MAG: substrate-binding domain-containing protein, partial [Burkholderiales bacterium]|nr:substrate-binding domain-containing protein [Burkholderiales bacterium]